MDFHNNAFEWLKENILGRKIHTTSRHNWTNEEICLAYRGQSTVESAIRNLKNPFHMAVRPQFHWTDQKIKVHYLICILSYLMTSYVYSCCETISITSIALISVHLR